MARPYNLTYLSYAAKDYDKAIKCFFTCTDPFANTGLRDLEFVVLFRAQEARCHIIQSYGPNMAKFTSKYVS